MGGSSDQKLRDKNNSQWINGLRQIKIIVSSAVGKIRNGLALLSNTDAADVFLCSRNDVYILKVGLENSPSGSVASILFGYEVPRRSNVEHIGESFVLAVLITNIKEHVVSNVSEI